VGIQTMRRLAAAQREGRVTRELRGLNNDKTIHIPFDYQVTYTHEEHKAGVVCRHLSVSVKDAGKGPSQVAVEAFMQEFGFRNRFSPLVELGLAWVEPLDDARAAVNVVEPLDGDLTRLAKVAP
jgi:hypothetical protein